MWKWSKTVLGKYVVGGFWCEITGDGLLGRNKWDGQQEENYSNPIWLSDTE